MLPNVYQDINHGPDWRKTRAVQIRDFAVASAGDKTRDLDCWDMYNEFYDETEFDYLRKIGDYELPAQVRNVGKQRPKINLLSSQQSKRPFIFSVSTIDDKSLKRKYANQMHDWLGRLDQRLTERDIMLNTNIQQILQQEQQLQQFLQEEPQSEEQAQQQQQVQQMLPQITGQIKGIKSALENSLAFNTEEMDKIKQYYKYDFKDIEEEMAQKLAIKLRERLNLREKSVKNFINQCVTGKQAYYVDYLPGEKLPRFESVNTQKIYYPSTDSQEWIQDGEWVVVEEIMSYSNVMRLCGDRLTKDQKDLIKDNALRNADNGSNFAAAPDGGAILSKQGLYSGTSTSDYGVRVWKIWYAEERKVFSKKSPNKYKKGEYFTHFITNGKPIINKKKFKYNRQTGYYVNPKNSEEFYNDKHVNTFDSGRGEKINTRYIEDRYRAIIVDNNDIVVDYGKDVIQPRSVDDLRRVILPVVGRTYNSITKRPYSLMWATRDLQKLYKIVSYHRELMLAISGTRGNVIDMSQKPAAMSMTEWEYQQKMGRLYIESVDQHGKRAVSPFNQWPSFDNTVSQAIQFLDSILISIDNEIGETMGISRPRLGKQVSTDQVGTNLQAQQMSELITEILYYDHDQIETKALSVLLNLAAKYCNNEDLILELNDSDLGRELMKIPKGSLNKVDLEILVTDNTKQARSMEELKQLAIKQNDKGQLPFVNLLEMWSIESLVELKKKFEYFTEEASKLAAEQAQAEGEQETQIAERKIKLEKEYEKLFEEQKNKLAQYVADIDKQRMMIDKETEDNKLELENRKLEQEKNLRLLEIMMEDKTETTLLANADKHETTGEKLRAIELKMEAIINSVQLSQNKTDSDKTHKENIKKLAIEDKKAKQPVKEHVNDN